MKMKMSKSSDGNSSNSSNYGYNNEDSSSSSMSGTDESEEYYVESKVSKLRNKRHNPNTKDQDTSSSSSSTFDGVEDGGDNLYNSDRDDSLYENRANGLSRMDRMRLSGRLAPDEEFQSLSEQAWTKRSRKDKLNLSKEELELRRSETARKRKAQAHMKAEEAKMNTIHKLLRRQASSKNSNNNSSAARSVVPSKDYSPPSESLVSIRYVISNNNFTFSIPEMLVSKAMSVLSQKTLPEQKPPTVKVCDFKGCSYTKKYRNNRNGLYSCGIEHYKLLLETNE